MRSLIRNIVISSLILVVGMSTVSAKNLPVVTSVDQHFTFKYKRFPGDVLPFVQAILRGDSDAGIELQYRITMDLILNAKFEISAKKNPLNQLIGIDFENVFGEGEMDPADVQKLANYLAFSFARQSQIENEHAHLKSFGMGDFMPFNIFYYSWNEYMHYAATIGRMFFTLPTVVPAAVDNMGL